MPVHRRGFGGLPPNKGGPGVPPFHRLSQYGDGGQMETITLMGKHYFPKSSDSAVFENTPKDQANPEYDRLPTQITSQLQPSPVLVL